jgi:hypothetical protein
MTDIQAYITTPEFYLLFVTPPTLPSSMALILRQAFS